MDRDFKQDLQNLTQYPEYYALKKVLMEAVVKMEDLKELDAEKPSRVTIETEVVARQLAAKKFRDLLVKLGLINRQDLKVRNQTYE